MANQGIFIVLEGSDGSGKTTQFDMLKKRLAEAGHEVETFDFPRYDKPSSHFITRYLNGEYGPAAKINPYTASLFYALDRYEAAPEIRKALADGKIVLSNRYVGSNMAHQGSKFHGAIEKRSFFVWEDSLEYQLLGIPRPHLNLFLRVPAEVSFELIGRKQARDYTDKSHDQHEADLEHLRRTVETYDLLCQLFPRDFHAIECVDNGKLMSVKQIGDIIWSSLKPLLPPPTKEVKTKETEPAPDKKAERPAEKQAPDHYRWELSQISLLAAMDIMSKLLPLEAKDAWGGKNGFKYYVPEGLSSALDKNYRRAMDAVVASYEKAQETAKDDAQLRRVLRDAVPLAATTSAHMDIRRDSAGEVIRRLGLSKNDEVRELGAKLTDKLVSLWPEIGKDVKEFEKQQQAPEAIGDIIEKLASDILPKEDEEEPLTLLAASPRNEFDLLAPSLQPYSDMPSNEIAARIMSWDYQQKAKALEIALSKSQSQALELASYRFSLLSNWRNFKKILSLGLFSDIDTLRSKPKASRQADVEAGAASEAVQRIYDKTASLSKELQKEHDDHILDYCALTGDNVRWQATISAGKLAEAQSAKLMSRTFRAMRELAQQAHPIIGESLAPARKDLKQSSAKPRRSSRRKP